MGAFCVFGISRSYCKAQAERKISPYGMTIAEWATQRTALAEKMYEEAAKPVKISPEFDAPQFCHDWIAAAPNETRLARVMVRGPKTDRGGSL